MSASSTIIRYEPGNKWGNKWGHKKWGQMKLNSILIATWVYPCWLALPDAHTRKGVGGIII